MDVNGKRVVVLGLGISGMEAAKLLRDKGARVTVRDNAADNAAVSRRAEELRGRGVEVELGRPLALPGDEDALVRLLLDKDWQVDNGRVTSTSSADGRELAKDWEHRGQERPLWIEPSGLVRNGNRRLAMIKRALGGAAARAESAFMGEIMAWIRERR